MSYIYVLTRLKDPTETTKLDFQWTKNVVNWATSLKEVKEKVNSIYPSVKNQWEGRKSGQGSVSDSYLWGQIPNGPRFEFAIHLQPFPWLSIDTTNSEEVIKVGRFLNLSILDIQTGEWIYIQNT